MILSNCMGHRAKEETDPVLLVQVPNESAQFLTQNFAERNVFLAYD